VVGLGVCDPPRSCPAVLVFYGIGRGKRVRLGLLLVWHAVIWRGACGG